jgi:uncharacterized protein
MSMTSERTYHDPLHGAITLSTHDRTENLLIHLIDTPAFQRLRRIRQLGPASLTFHGAEGSRFTHSLGVMAIARRAFDRLCLSTPQLLPYRPVVLCAALLHDLGHGPFSHTSEEIFRTHHEAWTCQIINESVPIRDLLDDADPTLRPQLLQVYQKSHPIPCIWQLVSSQLDCDRLDYLMRDSYTTGATYGNLDLDRILLALRYDPPTQQLVVAHKGLAAIEHYLVVRSFMYSQVYCHGKNIAATWGLEKAFSRARKLLAIGCLPEIDATLQSWLQNPETPIDLPHYLNGDDTLCQYHLQRWQTHPDPILQDLSRRWCDRDLLKAQDVSHVSERDRHHQLARVQSAAIAQGLDPHYYTGLRISRSRGYTLYQKGINLQTTKGLVEISEVSPLIQTLTQMKEPCWLIAPRSTLTL